MSETTIHPDSHPQTSTGRYNGIDLFRFIGAFFIMLLHTRYGRLDIEYQENIRLAARWAVPFFFMTTGFFLSKKIKGHHTLNFHHIESNIANLITILLVVSLAYLPIDIYEEKYPTSITQIFSGTFYHQWFIGSLIFGYFFLWYVYYTGRSVFLPLFCVLAFIYCLLTDSYDQLLGINLNFELGRYLMCIPFMYLGMWISSQKFSKKQIPVWLLAIVAGISIQYCEADLLYKYFSYDRMQHQILLGTIIMVVPLFILASTLSVRSSFLTRWGRKYSLFIYLYHPFYYYYQTNILMHVPREWVGNMRMFSPVIGFALILTFAILLDRFLHPVFSVLNGKLSFHKKAASKTSF